MWSQLSLWYTPKTLTFKMGEQLAFLFVKRRISSPTINLSLRIGLKTKYLILVMVTNTKEYMQQYYVKNCERIEARRQEMVTCSVCGATVTRGFLHRHVKTKRCIAKAAELKSNPQAVAAEIERHVQHLERLRNLM